MRFARFVPAFLARIVRALYNCIGLSFYDTNHNNEIQLITITKCIRLKIHTYIHIIISIYTVGIAGNMLSTCHVLHMLINKRLV